MAVVLFERRGIEDALRYSTSRFIYRVWISRIYHHNYDRRHCIDVNNDKSHMPMHMFGTIESYSIGTLA